MRIQYEIKCTDTDKKNKDQILRNLLDCLKIFKMLCEED